jgi:hypothetical protein
MVPSHLRQLEALEDRHQFAVGAFAVRARDRAAPAASPARSRSTICMCSLVEFTGLGRRRRVNRRARCARSQ